MGAQPLAVDSEMVFAVFMLACFPSVIGIFWNETRGLVNNLPLAGFDFSSAELKGELPSLVGWTFLLVVPTEG